MTSEELYKKQLEAFIKRYKIRSVLELGYGTGKSFKVFQRLCDRVVSVDLIFPEGLIYDKEKVSLVKQDVSYFIRNHTYTYDLVFGDISYYDSSGFEYSSDGANLYELKKFNGDLPFYWERVERYLIMNDYINTENKRWSINRAVNIFTLDRKIDFRVWVNRGGFAILKKTKKT